jgi:hypothetical protein
MGVGDDAFHGEAEILLRRLQPFVPHTRPEACSSSAGPTQTGAETRWKERRPRICEGRNYLPEMQIRKIENQRNDRVRANRGFLQRYAEVSLPGL